ncbi:MaoC/PaaZ C-terminal domain-containing protein [Pollutimonas bauzanensis]|uniref:MaoC like domain-containing protein n=1 Tax=Pollutimonas bauzanensis TaxID=658167 RepID=A0A1M5TKC4_9BURK|nr:MaoC/PaaZ C-terminal domain-containing protein [Pollutimonas bauzanensis]SHH51222.1 MaoC like domain-containing protein [Pollutimonas bauzanensis]
MSNDIHLRDMSVGQQRQTTHGPVSTTQLVKYAGASGDFNRIHFDYPFAREAGLEGVLAHGMLTMGFAASCLAQAIGPDALVTELSARFLAPVMAGDSVTVTVTLVGKENGALRFDLQASVGRKTVLQGKAAAAPHGLERRDGRL